MSVFRVHDAAGCVEEGFMIDHPKRSKERWDIILNRLGDKCSKCQLTYPKVVYDLHHPSGKSSRKDTPSRIIRFATDQKFLEHLETWQLLCANCHRLHHAEIGNWHPAVKPHNRGPCVTCGQDIISDSPRIMTHPGECRKIYHRQLIKNWKKRHVVQTNLRRVDISEV